MVFLIKLGKIRKKSRGPKTLGAEMELSIVDQEGCAYPINRSVLAGNLDPSFQLELDRFNLEYILPRFPWPELPSVEWSPS